MLGISSFILEKRKKILPIVLLIYTINLILSKLAKNNIAILLNKDYIIGIVGVNLFWFVISFLIKNWIIITKDWEIYKIDNIVFPYITILLSIVVCIAIPVLWFVEMPFDIFLYSLIWCTYYSALTSEQDNLEDIFSPEKKSKNSKKEEEK